MHEVDGQPMESMPVSRRLIQVEWAVLTLGIVLRLYLSVVNSEANDDHLAVIRIIADQHRLPRLRDAWEGFQPKLYHVPVAILWNLSPIHSVGAQIRIAQLVSCAAGIATIIVIRRALMRRGLSQPIGLLAFALVALNPKLSGLNAQATNDSFVILFATLALDQGWEFFRTGARRAFIFMTASTVLAALSKGNGLVVFVAVTATLMHALVRGRRVPGHSRRELAHLSAIFIVAVVALVGALGSYRANYEDTGSPFATNAPAAPLPDLVRRTYVFRPGTTSVIDTYFTFRFVDMLEHPTITSDKYVYPAHRTSLWSQLYGRANFVHFDQFPPSWRNKSLLVLTIGRLILVLALLPTVLLVAGLTRAVGALIAPHGRRTGPPQALLGNELFILSALGYIALIVLYSLTRRDFSTMKAEFLFPGLLAYVCFFADEAERGAVWCARKPKLRLAARWAFLSLLVLYVTDAVILAIQLT
jgi:hypothetical protein